MSRYFFGINALEVPINEPVEVGVFLDAEGEVINAVSGIIEYPEDVIIERVQEGNSLISLWVERPRVTEKGISFEGIIPGGISGQDMYLFSVFVTFTEEGDATLSTGDEKVLLHDGLGTPTVVSTSSLTVTAKTDAEPVAEEFVDIVPPEAFTPLVTSDPSLYDGAFTLLFSADDKESGIDHYEVRESTSKFGIKSGGEWRIGDSPYLLTDQSLRSFIEVRAVDRFGNVRTAQVVPSEVTLWYESPLVWSILLVTVILVILFSGFRSRLWRKQRKRR